MKELVIPRIGRLLNLTIKYNESKYNFEYVKWLKKIVLKRLENNQIIHIFDEEDMVFITEYDDFECTHFLTHEIVRDKKSEGEYKVQFVDYSILSYCDALDKDKVFCDYVRPVTDNSYILDVGASKLLYSVEHQTSIMRYERACTNDEIEKMFGRKVVFVEKEMTSTLNYDIKDNLSFGIDPITFEIVTPIWSEMQQRFIEPKKYTDDTEFMLALRKKGYFEVSRSLADNPSDCLTLQLEVVHYLDQIAMNLSEGDHVFDRFGHNFNKEFAKKFIYKK